MFDLELLMVADDENDQGYYEDEAVTQEEVGCLTIVIILFVPVTPVCLSPQCVCHPSVSVTPGCDPLWGPKGISQGIPKGGR